MFLGRTRHATSADPFASTLSLRVNANLSAMKTKMMHKLVSGI